MISLNLVANSTQYDQAINQEKQELGFEESETMKPCANYLHSKKKESVDLLSLGEQIAKKQLSR